MENVIMQNAEAARIAKEEAMKKIFKKMRVEQITRMFPQHNATLLP
jgi:hypothetical protein